MTDKYPRIIETRRTPIDDDAEWSDMGRDPRYPVGWWIIPFGVASGFVLGVCVAVLL